MAISGIRDLSVMETPPGRHRVLTFVGAYDQGTVVNAIRREMLREGQTFFVHNRVDSIDRVAYQVRQAIPRPGWPWPAPDARGATQAHYARVLG